MLIIKNVLDSKTQILAIFSAAFSNLNTGILYGWPSSTIAKLTTASNATIHLSHAEASYLTTLPPLAMLVTSLLIGGIGNQVGRKTILLLSSIPYCSSWTLTAIGTSRWTLYSSRITCGIGDACVWCTSPIYVGEVSRPSVRGTWGNLLRVNFCFGILLSYILGGYLEIQRVAYVGIALSTAQFALILCIPESPYYLIMRDRRAEARHSLEWLRQAKDVDAEYAEIARAVERQTQCPGGYEDLLMNPAHRKAQLTLILVRTTQLFSGSAAFTMYSHTISNEAGGVMSPTVSPIICGTIKVMVAIAGAFVVEQCGRRKTLFCSASSTVLILTLMSAYFYLGANTSIDVTPYSWCSTVGMGLYLLAHGLGLDILPTLISSEIFAASVKEKGMSVSVMTLAISVAVTTKVFHVLFEYGLYLPYAFYACSCFALSVCCYFVVPETKGKTLDEIQLILQRKK